jgi:hypothetical protein
MATTNTQKRLRGWAATKAHYTGFAGPQTIKAVLAQVPDNLRQRLTGAELGMVMSVANAAYHNEIGRAHV